MSLHQVEGIILRVREFGESDKILVIYTKEIGKIDAIAKGARKFKSKLAAATQQFSHGYFYLYRGKGMFLLGQAELKGSFPRLHGDLERLAYASYLCELTENFVPAEESQPEVFYHLRQALEKVNNWEEYRLAVIFFQLKLVSALGYKPVVDHCLNCGKERFSGQLFFNPLQGGVICEECNKTVRGKSRPLSLNCSAVLSHLQNTDWERLTVLKVSTETKEELLAHLASYINVRLEKRLKSVEFIKKLKKMPLA